jgi:predicted SAM-dependent methyltransferase
MNMHLACGPNKIRGFTNVDIRPEVNPDVVADIKNLSMFEAGSVNLIYLCHGLEHFKYSEIDGILQSFRRLLRPGGQLFLSVPNMEAMSFAYTVGDISLALIRGAISGGQEYPGNIHYSVWDFETLRTALEKNGFNHIGRYDAEAFLPAGFRDWSIGRIRDIWISLNVTSTSP